MFNGLIASPVLAVVMLLPLQYAECQTPLAPPPQIPYGMPISTRDATTLNHSNSASSLAVG